MPDSSNAYSDFTGISEFKVTLSRFFEKYIFKSDALKVDPKNITISTGVGTILASLSVSLFDEGDVVLIPTPYYAAFSTDLKKLGNVSILPIRVSTEDYKLTAEILEETYESALQSKKNVKGIIISNPNNPLGTIYSNEELELLLNV